MKQQKLKLSCIKYAARIVATMDVENKSKALFDLAEEIERYATPDECVEEKECYNGTVYLPNIGMVTYTTTKTE